MEYKTAKDSGICAIAKNSGVVERVSANEIVIRNDESMFLMCSYASTCSAFF